MTARRNCAAAILAATLILIEAPAPAHARPAEATRPQPLATAASTSQAGTAQARPTYAGLRLGDVLRDLNRQGLRIVFSTRLVGTALTVTSEPPGPTLREVLDQVLAPHGLLARPGPRGTLVVARAPRRTNGPTPAVVRTGTLRGLVVDADTGVPLPQVLVVTGAPEQRVTTGEDGRFELSGVAPGRHVVYVSLVGYVLARPDVEVTANGVAELVVPLAPGTGAYTEALTVRGTEQAPQSAAPVEFRIRSAELQELRGVLADDPFRAIQSMPGVATGDDFRAEFSVRGSEFRQMGFAVDGIASPWLVHGARGVDDTATVAMVNADVIDEVSLTSGAGPQVFGNRTGAWVQSAIREGSRDAFRMTGSLSFTGASAVVEGPLGKSRRGSWLLTGRQSYIDWLIRRIDTQAETTFGFTDAQAKLSYDVSPRHQVQLLAIGGRSRFDERDGTPSPNGLNEGTARTGLVLASWRATIGERTIATWRNAWSGVRYRNMSDFSQELSKGVEWLATSRLDASFAASPRLTLDGGASLDVDWATFRRQFYASATPTPVLRTWTTWQRDRARTGAYGRARWQTNATVAVDAGVRADHDHALDRTTGSPWVLARWSPSTRWSLGGGAGMVAQAPDLGMFSPDGTASPTHEERARYADVSAEFSAWPEVRVKASVYARTEADALRLDTPMPRLVNGVPFAPFASSLWLNATRAESRGVEVVVRRLASTGLVGWVSYAYGSTRHTDLETGERYWADFDQRHLLNVHTTYRIGTRTTAGAKFRYGSNMPVLGYFAGDTSGLLALGATRNAVRLPTYARLDLRLNRTYNYDRRRLTLFAEVLNALGRENVGRTDGSVRTNGQVNGFVETLLPRLPSVGIRVEF
jgi:Carboxypeptidase regulatory-like domain